MGHVLPGEEEPRPTFVGVAGSEEGGEPPTLNQALESAAERAIAAGLIKPGPQGTAWFELTFVEVELGNQHPRTFKAGVTYIPPGG
jgi:hypothetical protein